ncbi:MAG TPA: hypothetical protein VL137_16475 [Polyangiaceae bacterium]|nr:hypothetical protein [Polyangiaceae bacterium]
MSEALHCAEPSGWPSDATRDRLIGDIFIYQRRWGHRTGTDDVLTAWFAAHRFQRAPGRYLDLGTGVGSVLLMTAHRLRPQISLGVEAQEQSAVLARRSLAELADPQLSVDIVHADFRFHDFSGETFDLITASPPYFPLTDGVLPRDPQRLACRFDLRGGVEAYCTAAARLLSAKGYFFLVFQTAFEARVVAAASSCALHLTARADVRMRSDRAEPFLTVYEFQREPAAVHRAQLSIRTPAGDFTEDYSRARVELGVQ